MLPLKNDVALQDRGQSLLITASPVFLIRYRVSGIQATLLIFDYTRDDLNLLITIVFFNFFFFFLINLFSVLSNFFFAPRDQFTRGMLDSLRKEMEVSEYQCLRYLFLKSIINTHVPFIFCCCDF